MVSKSFEFLFDFGGPNSYLDTGRSARAAAKRPAPNWSPTPILLGGFFKAH
jgi:2-hydroxychromene-2-carboxylate isomerase